MGLRNRIADYLLRDEKVAFRDATEALWELWERRPWLGRAAGPSAGASVREALEEAARLGEIDPHLVDTLLRQMRYVRLGAAGGMGLPEEQERLEAVAESRRLWRNDVVTQQVVSLWTNFGFGQQITVEPEGDEQDEAAEVDETAEAEPEENRTQEVWTEFWDARRNRPVLKDRRLHRLSDRLLVDGELFFVAFVNEGVEAEDVPAGGVTLRTIATEQITEIVRDPEDEDVPLFYKREWTPTGKTTQMTLYYPDWEATEEDLGRADLPTDAARADEEKSGTGAYVLHAAYREIAGRGWPLQSAGAPWARAYRDFLQDRAAVAAAVAMYVRKLKVQGGSRAVDAMRSQIESTLARLGTSGETNPRAAAGSTFIENPAAELSNLPLRTGASDAAADGSALMGQVGLGGQVFPHWLGRGEAFRLATASAMELPVLKAFQRYQLWWADVWRDLVDLVLTMRERYGGEMFENHHAQVSTDALADFDVQQMSTALVKMYEPGLVPPPEAMRIALTLLGVPNVDDVLDKAFPDDEKRVETGATPAEERALLEAALRVVARG